MFKTNPTPKPAGLLNHACAALRCLQTPTATSGTGRHRGSPASERLTSIGAPGMGAHRRPLHATAPGGTAAQD
ncbi:MULTISPECIES: hypothetical protein [unclassified Streptomyces]|uniref:hypothetical protein n=1 Tax=unclassified Streptomyces TaxID=2593676 RepID=UPI0004BDAE29|nr:MULTISPECIES: hypothetical protein [unclassified Streptomyces]KOV97414.1 hypothetical protein ADL02_07480 [Streptomyces sp. NRRL WC-3723]